MHHWMNFGTTTTNFTMTDVRSNNHTKRWNRWENYFYAKTFRGLWTCADNRKILRRQQFDRWLQCWLKIALDRDSQRSNRCSSIAKNAISPRNKLVEERSRNYYETENVMRRKLNLWLACKRWSKRSTRNLRKLWIQWYFTFRANLLFDFE